MDRIKKKLSNPKLYCTLFGHKFIISRKITQHFKEYKCTVCKIELTSDSKGGKTELTPELKEVNETLLHFYKKKRAKI
jgi:hypothetical protein